MARHPSQPAADGQRTCGADGSPGSEARYSRPIDGCTASPAIPHLCSARSATSYEVDAARTSPRMRARLVRVPSLRGPVGRGRGQRRVPRVGRSRTSAITPPESSASAGVPIFDLDGTLIDSDEALVAPFVALGVPAADVTFGHVLADECARLGIDRRRLPRRATTTELAQPFPGVDERAGPARPLGGVLEQARRRRAGPSWPASAGRRRWRCSATPSTAPSGCQPVLDALGLGPDDVVFVGDTAHDRRVAAEVGAPSPWPAGTHGPRPGQVGDCVLRSPLDLLALLDRGQ